MKVLIIKHSWATLMAKGYKEYEFRTLKTNYRGEIFIHAAKTIDKYAAKRFEQLELEYSLGCVIAKATITDCIYVDEDFKKEVVPKYPLVYRNVAINGNWSGYGFKLKNVQEIEHIDVKGKLGLWNLDI